MEGAASNRVSYQWRIHEEARPSPPPTPYPLSQGLDDRGPLN